MAFPGGRKSEKNSEGLDPQAQVGRKKLSVIQIIAQQMTINLTMFDMVASRLFAIFKETSIP